MVPQCLNHCSSRYVSQLLPKKTNLWLTFVARRLTPTAEQLALAFQVSAIDRIRRCGAAEGGAA